MEDYFIESGFKSVIRRTSENVAGGNSEDLVSTAVFTTKTPLFVIEDLPGNYWPRPQ